MKRLLLLAAEMLDLASDEFGNHTCIYFKTPPDLTDADLQSIADLMDEANNGTRLSLAEWRVAKPDEATTPDGIRHYMTNFALMSAMAHMLRKMAESAATADDATPADVDPQLALPEVSP